MLISAFISTDDDDAYKLQSFIDGKRLPSFRFYHGIVITENVCYLAQSGQRPNLIVVVVNYSANRRKSVPL